MARNRSIWYVVGAVLSIILGCCSGLGGSISMLAEHPDPGTGRIVGAEESPRIFATAALVALAFFALGIYLLVQAVRSQRR